MAHAAVFVLARRVLFRFCERILDLYFEVGGKTDAFCGAVDDMHDGGMTVTKSVLVSTIEEMVSSGLGVASPASARNRLMLRQIEEVLDRKAKVDEQHEPHLVV